MVLTEFGFGAIYKLFYFNRIFILVYYYTMPATLEGTLHPAMKSTLAPEIQYNLGLTQSGLTESSDRVFTPQQGTVFNPSDQCSIVIPAVDFMDVSSSYLSFYHAGTGTGCALSTSANDLIYKVDIRDGSGTLLSTAEHQNLFNRGVSNYCIDSSAKAGTLQVTDGFGTLSERQGFAAGRHYALSLQNISPLFRSANRYLPLAPLQGITIEITWANANIAQQVTSGTSTYQVTQVQLNANLVRFDNPTTNALLKHWTEKGIKLSSVGHQYIPFTSTDQVCVLNLNIQKKSLKTLYVFPRLVSTINDPTQDSFATSAFSLKNISITCGDTVSPLYKNGAVLHKMVQRAYDYQVSGNVNWASWQTSAFVLAFDLEALSSVLSGFNSSQINSVISLQIEYSSPLPSQIRYDSIVEYDSVIEITAGNGSIVHA